MARTFVQLLQKQKQSSIARSTRRSAKWFQNKIKEFTQNSKRQTTSRPVVGGLYMYVYDPKYKETLPHYDMFPVVMPFRILKDGFVGINFHYLPPMLRAKLMDKLLEIHGNKKLKDDTKLKLSYQMLNSVASSKLIKPTVHRYLHGHVRSKIIVVPAPEWADAVMLPLAKFKGASKLQIYSLARN